MTTVKKDTETIEGMSKKAPSLPTQRVVLLLEQLMAEVGGKDQHGAQAYASERSGITEDYISKLLKGTRNVGREIIDTVCKQLNLRADFFFRELDVTPFYRDWLERTPGEPAIASSSSTFDESVAEVLDMMRATPHERAVWAKIANRFRLPQPHAPIAQAMLVAMRHGETPQRALDAAVEAATDEKLRQQKRGPITDKERDEDDEEPKAPPPRRRR